MANDAAWQAGWDAGGAASRKQKAPKNKKSADGNASPDVDQSAQKKQGGRKNPFSILSYIPHMKKGGRVKKTGLAVVHKGEYVVPAKHRTAKKASRKRTILKH